jgi:hypothetical protein
LIVDFVDPMLTRQPYVSRVLGVFLGLLCAQACCEDLKEPCLPWLEAGETYRVELVQHFEYIEHPNPFYDQPVPYELFRTPDRSCGQQFDLDVGTVIHMGVGEKVRGDGRQACGGCYYRGAITEIDGVERTLDIQDGGRGIGDYRFSEQFRAVLGGCEVTYTIGIAAVMPRFIAEGGQFVATDHMLYRELVMGDLEACAAAGLEVNENHRCWDSWAVRVWDSEGTLMTKDLPPPMQGGSNVDSGTTADGGA